ncbi:hypothetical protein CDV31_016395 [Fusarium ambrosium]|uniref:Uncharacterized protein n=1 Tax=Fusarium ambrosium TaxID=131363 RepID=A0A428S9J4_9HYPO|nr:hypothetical protein CDV31_016395 [Fusarium ambrosium]
MAARSEKPKDHKLTSGPREPGRVEKRREAVRPTDENLLREMEIRTRESLGNTRVEYQSPRVEDMEEAGRSPPQEETIVVAPSTATEETLDQLSDAEFRRLLPRLRTHLEKMGHQMQVEVIPDPPRHEKERKPRHVLEKIRATEEYDLPNFELGQHLKDTPITLSVLQLL